jgi:hypothetical protein
MGDTLVKKYGYGNQHLTKLYQGFPANQFVAPTVLPVYPHEYTHARVPIVNRDMFRMFETERSVGADTQFASISTDGYQDVELQEHSLMFKIDHRLIGETIELYDLVKEKVADMAGSFNLNSEYTASKLVRDTDSYPSANKATLAGNDQFTDTDSRPLDIISTGLNAIRNAVGIPGNAAIIGADAWNTLRKHASVISAFFGATGYGVVTVDMVKNLMGLDNLSIGTARYEAGSADGADAPTLTSVWEDDIILAYVPKAPSQNYSLRDLSFGYRLQGSNMPRVKSYPFAADPDRFTVVDGMDFRKHVILNSGAGYLIKNCNA